MVDQYDIYLVNLDPTIGHEIKKTRPCVVISPNEMNRNIGTVIVAPMTTTHKEYPTRVNLSFQRKTGSIVLDQIRTIDKRRLIKELGTLDEVSVIEVKQILKEMLVD